MISTEGEYEIEMNERKQKHKLKKYIAMAFILILVVVAMVTVGWTYYVRGGRVACMNSDSILVEGFECEKVARQPRSLRPGMQPINFTFEE